MRLLHVVPTYFPAVRYGGPIVSVHGLCRALAARGHHVEVFTTNVDGPGVLDVPAGIPVDLDGVRVTYFPSPFPRLYWSPAMGRALAARTGEFELLHTHAVFLWTGVAAAGRARRNDIPYVISPRGMLVPDLIQSRSRLVKTAWLRLFETAAFRGASAIHFTTALEESEARRVGLPIPSPFVVPNGVDLSRRPPIRREENMLLYVGRLNWKKGLERVIDALPSLPGVRFVIAGNDEESLAPALRARAAGLGVEERIQIRGPVYEREKDELLASATVFVLPSLSENFGNVVLEALAMETPVVLSSGVGLAREVEAAGAGAIGIEALAALLASPSTRQTMGRNGRALVEQNFGWSRVAEQMEAEYLRLAGRS